MKSAYLYKRIRFIIVVISILACVSTVPASAFADSYEFEEFFDGHGSVMLIIDADTGKLVDANESALDYYGYTYDELISMRIQDINCLTPEETKAEMAAAISEDRNHFLFEHRIASGETRNVEVYSYPFKKDGKNLLYSIINDITEKVALQDSLAERNRNTMVLGAIFILAQAFVIHLLLKSLSENKRIQGELFISKERYRTLFDNMEEGFALHEIITDESGEPVDYRFIDVNDAFKEATGLLHATGKTVKELLPGIENYWIEKYGKVALSGEPVQFESFSSELGKHYSTIAFSPAKNQFATIFFDISKRVEAERKLKEEKERLRTTLLSVGEGVIVTDAAGRVEYINGAAERISGIQQEDAAGRAFSEIFRIKCNIDEETEKFPVDDVLSTNHAIDWPMHSCLVIDGGECVEITISASPIMGEGNAPDGVVVVFRDVSEESRRRKEIEFMSYHDFLTNLYNRRFLEEEIARLDTARNLPLSIVYADVNGLKIVNDAFGHEHGDRLLTETARILKECCRSDDIIARVGGDEFAILLPSTSSEMANALVERIRKAIKTVDLPTGEMSVALGWDTKVDESQKLSDILRLSENHMYKRKIKENGNTRMDIVKDIMNKLYENVEYQKEHARKVSELCIKIGEALGLPEKEIDKLEILGLFHDIGMVGVKKEIQEKVGSLTEEDWAEIKRHPIVGRRILMSAGKLAEFSEAVMAHHERWDGNGYPGGLLGEEIPLHSRILAIADTYAAMTGKRGYRKPSEKQEAIDEIRKNAGAQFDPRIAETFLNEIGTEDI